MPPAAGRADDGRRRLPRARRITRGGEIRALFRRGRRRRTVHLDVLDAASPASYARVGLVVPRHGRRIVERNRLKRRLREVLRQFILPRLDEADLAVDVLVRARPEAYGASYAELKRQLEEWVQWRCSSG